MTPTQARALLELLADLYQLANTPAPEPADVSTNGRAAEEPVTTR